MASKPLHIRFRGRAYGVTRKQLKSSAGIPALIPLGDIEKMTLEVMTDTTKITENWSGNDQTVVNQSRITGGKINLNFKESTKEAFKLAFFGTEVAIAPETFTGAHMAVQNTTTKLWSKMTVANAPLVTGKNYFFVKQIASNGLSYTPYSGLDVDALVLVDSSTPAKTLTKATHFKIMNAKTGAIQLLQAGIDLAGLTYPIKASGADGLMSEIIGLPLQQGVPYALSSKNISNVVVKSTATSPVTIASENYVVDSVFGTITLTDIAAITTAAGDYSLAVSYLAGTSSSIALATDSSKDMYMRFDGVNTLDDDAPMSITINWASFMAGGAVDFFEKDFIKTPLVAELVADPDVDSDDALGKFGHIDYL